MKNRFYILFLGLILLSAVFLGLYYLNSTSSSITSSNPDNNPDQEAVFVPTQTPRPTATPIIPPSQNEIPGDLNFFYGDWDGALNAYQQTLDTAEDNETRSSALLGIGTVHFELGDYQKALDSFRQVITNFPDSSQLAKTYFLLGETYSLLDRDLEAAAAYESYLLRRPNILDGYILEKIGDRYASAGEHLSAISTYQTALPHQEGEDLYFLQLKIGEEYQEINDHQTAITVFNDIYSLTGNDYVKARADYLLGLSYTELNQPEQANRAWLDAVNLYPLSYDSYRSLLELVNRGVEVDDLNRGLVDYYAGQYSVAVEAFDRYLNQPEPEDPGTAYYFKGFSLRAMERHEDALVAWQNLIDQYPDHAYWDEAWEFKAYSEWFYLGQNTTASNTLQEFVATSPYHPRAGEFLFDAGRVEERRGQLEEAAALWKRVFNEYPTSGYANLALFKSGIIYYRLGDFDRALSTFTLYRDASADFEELAQALFWIGKVHQVQGNQNGAGSAWSAAAEADPTGYYSERARDLLQGRDPFSAPPDYDFGFDVEAENLEAQAWIREAFAVPEDTNLNGLGLLGDDPRIIRGRELWDLGLYEEAREVFDRVREEVSYDPVSSYRLAIYFRDLGLYRSAIFSARQVLNAAGMDDATTMNAPVFFNHIRFGTYYQDLVIPAAQENNFHPLLLFSIIRQESLFEGFVQSSAGARGLMQIIPSTGADIAEKEGWPPDYTADDLYRPEVSVRFGAAYLAFLDTYFEGDIYATLAGYNGGLGNASVWLDESNGDPDLFLEIIRFSETETYLKSISEVYAIYRRFYTRSQ